MLHSSCLSALASISSSVTRMIKTSLKHLSQGQNMGGGQVLELKWVRNRANLAFLFFLHPNMSYFSDLSVKHQQWNLPQLCCQFCTMFQDQLNVMTLFWQPWCIIHLIPLTVSGHELFSMNSVCVCVFLLVKWISLDSFSNNSMFSYGCISVER